ncbi:hypothetical protein [Kitasatospora griseola]|uniref:hypothetical protein n=1 Tax=Kitasatospora griseola TaxID=2064 RepID=UPI003431C8A8
MADGRILLTVDPDAWHGHGFELRWTEDRGWNRTPLDTCFDPLWTATEPLPLPEPADPDDVTAATLLLLAGDDGFVTGTRWWEVRGLPGQGPGRQDAFRTTSASDRVM